MGLRINLITMRNVDIDSLPDDLRAQIEELGKEPEPLFPIAPREFTNVHMQTKEFVEITQKVDKLIEAVNTLYENQNRGK